jgi:hypothetical protein
MYGVPSDLNLTAFHGRTLTQIWLGEFQLQFNFADEAHLSVEGAWQLLTDDGTLIDVGVRGRQPTEYRLHCLLGRTVLHSEVHAPEWIDLHFSGGVTLRVFDDSAEYVSFSIQPGDIYV